MASVNDQPLTEKEEILFLQTKSFMTSAAHVAAVDWWLHTNRGWIACVVFRTRKQSVFLDWSQHSAAAALVIHKDHKQEQKKKKTGRKTHTVWASELGRTEKRRLNGDSVYRQPDRKQQRTISLLLFKGNLWSCHQEAAEAAFHPHGRVNKEGIKHRLCDIQVQSDFMRLLLGNSQ